MVNHKNRVSYIVSYTPSAGLNGVKGQKRKCISVETDRIRGEGERRKESRRQAKRIVENRGMRGAEVAGRGEREKASSRGRMDGGGDEGTQVCGGGKRSEQEVIS